MADNHKGSCLCGAVQFEITGAFDGFFLCHCRRCRKNSGSAHAANLFSPNAKLQWLSGEANIKTYRVPDSRHQRAFCLECGSALPNLHENGALLVVPAGSLDTPLDMRPTAHIFAASRADWDHDLGSAPAFDEFLR
jgi:hypothetical protein